MARLICLPSSILLRSVTYQVKKLPVWGEPSSSESFMWPTLRDIAEFPNAERTTGLFNLKEITFKSNNDGLTEGICSAKVDLTNGESSGEIAVPGRQAVSMRTIQFPQDLKLIRKVEAYCDEQGVYNIYFKDLHGQVVCSYDPKKYGEIAN